MNDNEKAELVARYDAWMAKLQKENAELRTKLREVSQRFNDGAESFQQNFKDEAMGANLKRNLIEHKGWVIAAVAVAVIVVLALVR